MTTKIDKHKVRDILNNATWDYTYVGMPPSNAVMADMLETISDEGFTVTRVSEAIKQHQEQVIEEFDGNDIDEFAAYYIGDYVAKSLTMCKFDNVKFVFD
jgi:hypothetical protein